MSAAENFVSVIEQYFGQGMFLVLFVIAYVIFYRRSNERIRKGLIAGTIGVLCFLNPITFRIISALGEQETYYRLIWMVPVLLGAAIVSTASPKAYVTSVLTPSTFQISL